MAAERLLDVFLLPVPWIVATLAFAAAAPWVSAWLWGTKGGSASIWVVLALLIFLPTSLFAYCVWTACGQGAILVFLVAVLAALGIVVLFVSAAFAAYVWRDRPGAGDDGGRRPS
jgi:hypothetical protein